MTELLAVARGLENRGAIPPTAQIKLLLTFKDFNYGKNY